MNKQVIHSNRTFNILLELLNTYCNKENNFYIINNILYKKLIYNSYLQIFLIRLREHYYKSKLNYLDNCNTYNNFITIIRQICNFNNIAYNTHVVYEKSRYVPIYYVNMSSVDIL
jgi:hypothetical protein